MNLAEQSIAVIIPCYNEARAIAQVLEEFKLALPTARLYVFDNASTDDTSHVARQHGATVIAVELRGKGNVIRRGFADIQADIYVMIDGDATYDVSNIEKHIQLLLDKRLDMVAGYRQDNAQARETYRPGHRLGNRLLTGAVRQVFGGQFIDMLSGYRVFSHRYVKTFPAMAAGFELETELTIHALELRMPYAQVPVGYRSRPEGSASKLSTFADGWRILKTIVQLYASERPLAFFGLLAALLVVLSLALFVPLAWTYLDTGLVPRLPTAVLAASIMLCALLCMVCGVILHAVTQGRREVKHLAYLAIGQRHTHRD